MMNEDNISHAYTIYVGRGNNEYVRVAHVCDDTHLTKHSQRLEAAFKKVVMEIHQTDDVVTLIGMDKHDAPARVIGPITNGTGLFREGEWHSAFYQRQATILPL